LLSLFINATITGFLFIFLQKKPKVDFEENKITKSIKNSNLQASKLEMIVSFKQLSK
jgi:hypothetical protein